MYWWWKLTERVCVEGLLQIVVESKRYCDYYLRNNFRLSTISSRGSALALNWESIVVLAALLVVSPPYWLFPPTFLIVSRRLRCSNQWPHYRRLSRNFSMIGATPIDRGYPRFEWDHGVWCQWYNVTSLSSLPWDAIPAVNDVANTVVKNMLKKLHGMVVTGSGGNLKILLNCIPFTLLPCWSFHLQLILLLYWLIVVLLIKGRFIVCPSFCYTYFS